MRSVALAALAAVFALLCETPFGAAQTTSAPSNNAALIKEGEYLAKAGDCIACHSDPGGKPFAGGRAMPTPFGTLYSSNISPDPTYGIGRWTAEQFYNMLHTGRSPDGALIYPAMPFQAYTKVTRRDSDAIFAYLRSVPAVHQPNKPNELRFPYNNRELILGWRTLFFNEGEYKSDPAQTAEWNRGAYLVDGLGHCAMCHSPINALGGTSEAQQFQGGLIPMQFWYAPSLTSDKEAGLGEWSMTDIVDLLRKGISNRGAVYGPMAEVVYNSLQYLSDADIQAMAVYLKSLGQRAPAAPAPSDIASSERSLLLSLGQTVYAQRCASCHGADGKGKPPDFPPLADNQSTEMESAVNPIRMVLNGGFPPGTQLNPTPFGMPPFASVLSDDQVAAVVTYIRTAWSNHGSAISAQQANELRAVPLD